MSDDLLRVKNLTTGYGDLRVVWDVSFTVRPGTVHALLGRNGAGKTTTLRAIAGLNPAISGTIEFQGEDLNGVAAFKRARRGIGYVQEGKRIFGDMTVEENLLAGSLSVKLSRGELKSRLDEAYDLFPALGERRKRLANLLSGGQQQMLAIAQAVVPQPKLLLVDEPSAGLAPAIVGNVLENLSTLRDRGYTIILVEQSVDFALAISDDLVVLDLGRVVHSGSASSSGAHTAIRNAYLGRLEPVVPAE